MMCIMDDNEKVYANCFVSLISGMGPQADDNYNIFMVVFILYHNWQWSLGHGIIVRFALFQLGRLRFDNIPSRLLECIW